MKKYMCGFCGKLYYSGCHFIIKYNHFICEECVETYSVIKKLNTNGNYFILWEHPKHDICCCLSLLNNKSNLQIFDGRSYWVYNVDVIYYNQPWVLNKKNFEKINEYITEIMLFV